MEPNTLKTFSPILDGYCDLLADLNPENSKCEVDKVVKYILDKNILVRHVNVALANITNFFKSPVLNKLSVQGFVDVGRFTPGESGENASILKRWHELMKNIPVLNPSKCIKDFVHENKK